MPITFKSERRKVLKMMYNDMVDAYVAEIEKNNNLTKEEREELIEDANVWKIEYREMIEAL